MNPAVTLRMKQYAVAHSIASTVDSPDDLVASPSGCPRDPAAALGAESTLAYPETEQLLSPFRISLHLQIKPTLEVNFTSRVVRVSIPSDLDVSDDWEGACAKEPGDTRFSVLAPGPFPKNTATIEAFEVLLVDPPRRLVAVSSLRPAPQAVEEPNPLWRECSNSRRAGDSKPNLE